MGGPPYEGAEVCVEENPAGIVGVYSRAQLPAGLGVPEGISEYLRGGPGIWKQRAAGLEPCPGKRLIAGSVRFQVVA
jgi:hypothetical protein